MTNARKQIQMHARTGKVNPEKQINKSTGIYIRGIFKSVYICFQAQNVINCMIYNFV